MTLPSGHPMRGTPPRQSADLDASAPLRARTTPSHQHQPASPGADSDAPVQGLPIMPVTDTGNRASWENSHGTRQQTISARPPGSGLKAMVWLGAGSLLLLVLAFFVWSARPSQPAAQITPVLSTPSDPTPASAPPVLEPVPAAAAPTPALSPAPEEAVAKDAANAAPEDSNKARTEPARPIEATPTPAMTPESRIRRSAPPSAPPASPAVTGKGLTDFGGRR